MFFASALIFCAFFIALPVFAENACEKSCDSNDATCLQEKINECTKLQNESREQAQTLAQTITFLNNKIKLTEKQIRLTEIEIEQLEKEIGLLNVRIDGLEFSLKRLTEVLLTRIQDEYKQKPHEPMLLLLTSNGFSDFVARYKYVELSQQYTQKVIHEAEAQKILYSEQKITKEQKQAEVEGLKKKLQVQRNALDQQKAQKQTLLTATKNDEAKYQSLLQQALAEKNALEEALISGSKVGPVKKGDAIALVGNSGYPYCSTGAHLHFEVRKNNVWVDPTSFLSSKSIQDEEKGGQVTIGSGSWDWPIQDPIRLTQHFGHTEWSWRYTYSGGIHTGFDMVSSSSKVIKAPADGTLFSFSQKCGSSTINIKYIEHGDGVISFYLHVQ